MNENSLKQLGFAKKLVFITLILYVTAFVIMNSSYLTGDNIGRFLFSVEEAITTRNLRENSVIAFEESKQNTKAVFKDGFILLSQRTLTVYSKNNLVMAEHLVNFSEPVLKLSDNYIVCFERDGNILYLFDSFNQVGKRVLEEKIINVTVSDDGYIAVLTQTYGYKAKLTVINRSMDDVYYWFSAKTYLMDTVFSTSNIVSLIGVEPDRENVNTVIHRINFRTGEEQKTFTSEATFPLSIKKKSDNSIELLTDSGTVSVRNDACRVIFGYADYEISSYYQDVRHTVFSCSVDNVSKLFSVIAISSTGEQLFEKNYFDVRAVCCYFDVFLVLSENKLYVLNKTGEELKVTDVAYSGNGLCANRDALFVTGAAFAERLDISAAFS